jgi:hypothetical protein
MEAATKNGETIFVLNRELLQTINSRLPEVKGRHDRRTAGFFGLVHEATDEAFNLLDIGEGTIWRDKTPIRIFSRWEVHEMINSEAQPFQWQPMPEGRYKMLDCV